jgi:hypothetical protein
MTTVNDCMQEIIAKGPGYFIRGGVPSGEQVAAEWDPTALLEDMQHHLPGVLEDHAWTEWSVRPDIGVICLVHYGVRGFSLGYMEVPGYGKLCVLVRLSVVCLVIDRPGNDAHLSMLSRSFGKTVTYYARIYGAGSSCAVGGTASLHNSDERR